MLELIIPFHIQTILRFKLLPTKILVALVLAVYFIMNQADVKIAVKLNRQGLIQSKVY